MFPPLCASAPPAERPSTKEEREGGKRRSEQVEVWRVCSFQIKSRSDDGVRERRREGGRAHSCSSACERHINETDCRSPLTTECLCSSGPAQAQQHKHSRTVRVQARLPPLPPPPLL